MNDMLLSLSKNFRIEEFIQFFNDVAGLCKNSNPNELKIKVQYKALLNATANLENEFKQERKSDRTEEIQELDRRRDEAVICIRKIADGNTNHFAKAKYDAGKAIVQCIDKYGSAIYKKNYKAETGILSNLGNDLQNDSEMSQSVALLDLTDVVNEMVSANKKFNERFLMRIEEQTEDISQSATDLLIESKTAYEELTDFILAYNTIEPSEELSSLINKLNTLIESYNQTADNRNKSQNNEDKEE